MLSVITYIRYSKEASRDTGVGLFPAASVVPRLGSTSVVLGSGPPEVWTEFLYSGMSSRNLIKQTADTAEADKLPLWDGTHLTGLPWLRELEACEHLFDADVAYFLRTAAVVTSAAKTAVSSHEHAALLKQDIIRKQEYSVLNPPPDEPTA